MLMKKLLFCFFMSLLMVASAVAQTRNITVRGKVIDKDSGEPVVQATIQMLSLPDSTYVNGAATLDDGTFELPKVSAGNYVMKISFIGYKNIFEQLTLASNRTNVDVGTKKLELDAIALREAVVNSFAHARYDLAVQHEIDIYSNRISIINPGSFANEFTPIDYVNKDLHSYLRNEQIANILYLCKNIESFGSGLKRIYSSCADAGVAVSYENEEVSFKLEFSREDRNKVPGDGTLNGTLNDESLATISEIEDTVLTLLRENNHMTSTDIVERTGKSKRTVNRVTTSLQAKDLIERVGSKKTGYWRAK